MKGFIASEPMVFFYISQKEKKMLIGFSKTLYLFRLCQDMGRSTTVKAMPSVRTNLLLSSAGQNRQDPFSVLPSEISSLLFRLIYMGWEGGMNVREEGMSKVERSVDSRSP